MTATPQQTAGAECQSDPSEPRPSSRRDPLFVRLFGSPSGGRGDRQPQRLSMTNILLGPRRRAEH